MPSYSNRCHQTYGGPALGSRPITKNSYHQNPKALKHSSPKRIFTLPFQWVFLMAHHNLIYVATIWPFSLGQSGSTNFIGSVDKELTPGWKFLHFGVFYTMKIGLDLRDIIIYGDSKPVIEWANEICNLEIATLSNWKQMIKDMFRFFWKISISHHPHDSKLWGKQTFQDRLQHNAR